MQFGDASEGGIDKDFSNQLAVFSFGLYLFLLFQRNLSWFEIMYVEGSYRRTESSVIVFFVTFL